MKHRESIGARVAVGERYPSEKRRKDPEEWIRYAEGMTKKQLRLRLCQLGPGACADCQGCAFGSRYAEMERKETK